MLFLVVSQHSNTYRRIPDGFSRRKKSISCIHDLGLGAVKIPVYQSDLAYHIYMLQIPWNMIQRVLIM